MKTGGITLGGSLVSSKFRYVDLLIFFRVVSSDRSDCFGGKRFVGYFGIKVLSIELERYLYLFENIENKLMLQFRNRMKLEYHLVINYIQ